MTASFGANAGIDAYADPLVATLLGDVRGRLLQHATEAWIEHSPRVVAGMEEELRQITSIAARTLSIPPTATTEIGPSAAGPGLSVLSLLGEYVRRVKEGSMTQAEFDELSDVLLSESASQDPHRVHSPSVKVSCPSSRTAPPIPVKSGRSVPSSSSARRTAPPAVANPLEVTVRPARNSVRQAAVAAATGLVVCII